MKTIRKSSTDLYVKEYVGSSVGDMPTDFLQKTANYRPCAACGTPTPWLDLELSLHVCSKTCRSTLLERHHG